MICFVVRDPDGEDITILSEAACVPRVDDRKVISGIVYVLKNGWQWKDAPKASHPVSRRADDVSHQPPSANAIKQHRKVENWHKMEHGVTARRLTSQTNMRA